MSKKEDSLKKLYPQLFQGKYYLGTSVGPGWRPLLEKMCQDLIAGLSPEDAKKICCTEIKQKFGGLRVHWRRSLTKEGLAIATKITDATIDKAERSCEECGSEGRLYPTGYWKTLCDVHALQDGRVFPKAYGIFIDCNPDDWDFPTQFGDDDPIEKRNAICDRLLYFKNTCARAWYWSDATDHERWVFWRDIPAALQSAYHHFYLPEHAQPEIPHSIPGSDAIDTVSVGELLRVLDIIRTRDGATSIIEPCWHLPPGANTDSRTLLERNIATHCKLDVETLRMIPATGAHALAVTADKNEQRYLFSIPVGERPRQIEDARSFLQQRITHTKTTVAILEAALADFPQDPKP